MTSNQLAYWRNVETERSNRAMEYETARANRAKESLEQTRLDNEKAYRDATLRQSGWKIATDFISNSVKNTIGGVSAVAKLAGGVM